MTLKKLRPYQEEAEKAIIDNEWNGILAMGTGTGKTFTSLDIANKFKLLNDRILLVILVPFLHLSDQWKNNCNEMGFENIVECSGTKESWRNKLIEKTRSFNSGLIDDLVVISTYITASSDEFQKKFNKVERNALLIADECHYFTLNSFKNNTFKNFKKIGLSATPERWFDDDGTDFIKEEFKGIVFEYDIERAMNEGSLVRYKYYPVIIDLNEEERETFKALNKAIASEMSKPKREQNREVLDELRRKRNKVISKAEQKIGYLDNVFSKKDVNSTSHTIVYCAERQVEMISKLLSDKGFRVRRFDSKVPKKERLEILKQFENGFIQILVAIKCLDEGVDIPATHEAYFLASTSNPREFIQRRGRILRPYQGKKEAIIHDCIVLPSCGIEDKDLLKSVASSELPRFAEFSKHSKNQYLARQDIKNILTPFDLEYLMNKLPWEVYNELKEMENNEWKQN